MVNGKKARLFRLLVVVITAFAGVAGALHLAVRQAIRQQQRDAALIAAVKRNDARRVLVLLAEGADANTRETQAAPVSPWLVLRVLLSNNHAAIQTGPTALMLAAQWRYPCFPDGSMSGIPMESDQVVMALLQRGADVNCTSIQEYNIASTPLVMAAWVGNRRAVRLLVEAGADVNAVDGNGMTALDWSAIFRDAGNIKLLLRHGANVNRHDNRGGTAFYRAFAPRIARELSRAGYR